MSDERSSGDDTNTSAVARTTPSIRGSRDNRGSPLTRTDSFGQGRKSRSTKDKQKIEKEQPGRRDGRDDYRNSWYRVEY